MYLNECRVWVKDIRNLPPLLVDKCVEEYGSPIIVLGDSHAMNIYNIISKSEKFQFVIGISQGWCRPHSPKENCHYESFIDFMKENNKLAPYVVYHQSGSYFIHNKARQYEPSLSEEVFFDADNVVRVVDYLNKLAALKLDVLWLGAYTEYRVDPRRDPIRFATIPKVNFEVFDYIDKKIRLLVNSNFRYVPFSDFYTVEQEVVFDDCLIWMDEDHFSTCGEEIVVQNSNWDVFEYVNQRQ